MSRVHPKIDRAAGISYWKAPEILEAHHVEAYLKHLLTSPDYSVGLQEVLDFNGVEECRVTTDNVNRMVACQRVRQNELIGNQRALICSSDLVYGLCRMFTLKSGEVPMEIQVFREVDGAAEWLGIDYTDFQALPAMWEGQIDERDTESSFSA